MLMFRILSVYIMAIAKFTVNIKEAIALLDKNDVKNARALLEKLIAPGRKRKMSGYNAFIGAHIRSGGSKNDASILWGNLDAKKKEEWYEKASEVNATRVMFSKSTESSSDEVNPWTMPKPLKKKNGSDDDNSGMKRKKAVVA